MLALLAAAAALAPCAPETPPALQLTGIPSVAIPGKAYAATLSGDGPVVDSAGSDIGVKDATGRGWNAHYEYARGVTQPFSVGLSHAPFTVTASWTEPGPCLRTVTVPLPIERHILAVVNCKRGAEEPRDRARPALRRLQAAAAVALSGAGGTATRPPGAGRSTGARRRSRSRGRASARSSTASSTRARPSPPRGRTLKRVPIDCPLPPRS